MGLDMYAWRVKAENAVGDFDFNGNDENKPIELFYWRKHHDLHGWMENLYESKGGDHEFNCIPVRLTLEDLDNLEKDIRSKMLPETRGFFFGDNPPDEESNLRDLDFIDEARAAIEAGDAVYYDSWW
jgi:hypothetical protein